MDRSNNTVANALSKLAMTDVSSFGGSVYLKVLDASSIQKAKDLVIERSNY